MKENSPAFCIQAEDRTQHMQSTGLGRQAWFGRKGLCMLECELGFEEHEGSEVVICFHHLHYLILSAPALFLPSQKILKELFLGHKKKSKQHTPGTQRQEQ